MTLTRIFDAPREAVFRAWTNAAEIARWLGPRSIKAEIDAMEVRPGGAYRIVMHLASGETHKVSGVYREIVAHEHLVFSWAWDAEAGRPRRETDVTIAFREIGEKAEVTLQQERFENKAARADHHHGWTGSFDKLAEALAGRPGHV